MRMMRPIHRRVSVRHLPTLGAIAVLAGLVGPSLVWAAEWPDRTGEVTSGDFDNDGDMELVVSSPESDCGEGIVYVIDIAGGTVTSWTQDTSGVLGTAACGDNFGTEVVVGDFNGDSYDDLAISSPGDDDSGVTDAGVVNVLYGSASGLSASADQMFHQDSTGLSETAEADDDFGGSLEAGDFDCDGYDDLAIGVPLESFTILDAGGVHVLYGSASGISTVEDWWRQGLTGVEGSNGEADHFGASLAVGNFNGDTDSGHACEDLAIGIPDEDFTRAADGGRVYAIYGAPAGLDASWDIVLHQDKTDVDDQIEAGDRFSARLSAADLDADDYDDLIVIVPGDGCAPSISVGSHVFSGGSSGFVYANSALSCTSYGCTEAETDQYGCRLASPPVYGTSADEMLLLLFGDDTAWGEAGADSIRGSHGTDVLFGGAGNDTLNAGAGLDVQIGGDGNDTFTIDADCEVVAGEVVDGGPGTDIIESHLSQSALQALGLTITSVETFTTITEHPDGDAHCALGPFEEGPGRVPVVTMSWLNLPNEDSVFTTSSSELALDLVTTVAGSSPKVDITFTLHVRGEEVSVVEPTVTMTTATGRVTLDLNDFIPSGVDSQAGDPTLYSSAWITTHATVTIGSDLVDDTYAPTLYGHIDVAESEAVLYREKAMHDVYGSGDLGHIGHAENPWPGTDMGPPVEGRGSVCVPSQ